MQLDQDGFHWLGDHDKQLYHAPTNMASVRVIFRGIFIFAEKLQMKY